MLEAAERRQKEQEGRGLHNPERVKAKQKKMEELERRQEEAVRNHGGKDEGLRVGRCNL